MHQPNFVPKQAVIKYEQWLQKDVAAISTLLLFYSLAYMLTSNMIDGEDKMTVKSISSFAKKFIINLTSSFTLRLREYNHRFDQQRF